jgi:hypothetical protein
MTTTNPAAIISYLLECYRSDNREEKILDVFASKVNFRLFIEKKDALFNGLLPRIALKDEKLAEVAKTAALQQREKKTVPRFRLCDGSR